MTEDDTSSQFPVLRSQLCSWPNRSYEAVQDLAHFRCFIQQLLALLWGEVAQVLGDHQLGLHFDQRASPSTQKIKEIIR